MSNIKLNFLPLVNSDFNYTVYVKERNNQESDNNLYAAILISNGEKKSFWVSFEPLPGFVEKGVAAMDNIGLTNRYLFKALVNKVSITDIPFEYHTKSGFTNQEIFFITHEYPQGNQTIHLSSYYLREKGMFGFLIDTGFIKKDGVSFDKEIQRLSLSLDSNYRSNKDYYYDKYKNLRWFIQEAITKLVDISNTPEIKISTDFILLPSFILNKKEYIFNNKNTSFSQFQGIRNFGPYKKLNEECVFTFVFEEKYKSFANELYLSLVGKSNPGTFSGMYSMFNTKLEVNNVKRVILDGYEKHQLDYAINEIKNIKESEPNKKHITIYIENYSEGQLIISNAYYYLKYSLINIDIPLQVVNYKKLGDKNALKWSTSNVGLQIFAKLGGIPWLVKPSNNNCIILGIGSSHKRDNVTGLITKYFAYTVCLDSSGLYKSLKILAEDTVHNNYLEQLKANLKNLLQSEILNGYTTCALHLPFKIKKSEIAAIKEVIQENNSLNFVAIKINTENKFFGFSSHNTLVPYESSFIKLSDGEYLVWFEGLHYGKEIVDKRLSNPVHIQFLNIGDTTPEEERKHLQDVLNLSGANWRGFNSKSIPISIYYSKIITEYTKEFEDIEGYDERTLSNEKPWFL